MESEGKRKCETGAFFPSPMSSPHSVVSQGLIQMTWKIHSFTCIHSCVVLTLQNKIDWNKCCFSFFQYSTTCYSTYTCTHAQKPKHKHNTTSKKHCPDTLWTVWHHLEHTARAGADVGPWMLSHMVGTEQPCLCLLVSQVQLARQAAGRAQLQWPGQWEVWNLAPPWAAPPEHPTPPPGDTGGAPHSCGPGERLARCTYVPVKWRKWWLRWWSFSFWTTTFMIALTCICGLAWKGTIYYSMVRLL